MESDSAQHQELDFDIHFPSTDTTDADAFTFFGSSSVYVLSAELLAAACPHSSLLQQFKDPAITEMAGGVAHGREMIDISSSVMPSRALVHHLVDAYENSCMLLWPLQLEDIDDTAIDNFLQSTYQKVAPPSAATRPQSHLTFQIAMICAIASAHTSRVNSAMAACEQFFYLHASKGMNEVLSEATAESLVDLLLLIIYLLFRPDKGDLWMLLELACRLAVELGHHRDHARSSENLDQTLSRSRTFWTLYRLEHAVAEMYGRPSDDLESIITIDIPANILMSHVIDHLDSPLDTISSSMAILSRLRSDIFRTIYLPARATRFLEDDVVYHTILDKADRWYHDISQGGSDILRETMFKIAYHALILFLNQKSLLQILLSLSPSQIPIDESVSAIIVRSFSSAYEIIKSYENVILSDNGARVPGYPVTFISAHEICAASLTVMAYCFFIVDSQARSLAPRRLRDRSSSKQIDLPLEHEARGKLHHISASCLSLLTWCSIQWPEMAGMLEIFKELSVTLLPKLSKEDIG